MRTPAKRLEGTFESLTAGYSKEPQPLGAYLTLMGAFGALASGLAGAVWLTGSKMPKENAGPGQMVLIGIATHKLARLITKDRVTAPLRAPFVEYKKGAGEGEVEEEPRGEGMQQAIGDLVTCPYCIGVWIATPLWFGMLLAPRLTRFVVSVLASITAADFMHRVYLKAKNWGDS